MWTVQPGCLIGVVHLGPLPGSPGFGGDLDAVVEAAARDAQALVDAGFDGWIVENFGDAPFFPDRVPASTLCVMTRIALALPHAGGLRGVNVLRNDARGALAVALGAGLDFIRINVHVGATVTDQGIVSGRAFETARQRAALAPGVGICADVAVKHARVLGEGFDLGEEARETAYRGLADGLIVSGAATGSPTALGDLEVVRAAVPDRVLLVGSGATAESAAGLLRVADGLIVGTALKEGGRTTAPVSLERARAFVDAARGGG